MRQQIKDVSAGQHCTHNI